MQILFKFQVNQMKNDDFRNLTSRWPLTSKSIGFSVETTSTTWWSFVKIGLKLWPVGNWQTYKRIEYQNWLTNIVLKILHFASNKQTERGENITSFNFVVEVKNKIWFLPNASRIRIGILGVLCLSKGISHCG